MSYLTKTDVKIAIKTVWDIGKWIMRGANPMEPFEGMETSKDKTRKASPVEEADKDE